MTGAPGKPGDDGKAGKKGEPGVAGPPGKDGKDTTDFERLTSVTSETKHRLGEAEVHIINIENTPAQPPHDGMKKKVIHTIIEQYIIDIKETITTKIDKTVINQHEKLIKVRHC